MKLIPKKGGNGYTSSFTLNISLNAVRRCGFLKDDGTTAEVEIEECPAKGTLIIKQKPQNK